MNSPDLSFYNSIRYKVALSVVISIFFYAFMIIFLPFGVSNYNPNHEYTAEFLIAIGIFMVVTFVVSLLNELLLRPFIFKAVTFRNIVLWSIWTFILLGLVNFFVYNIQGNWHDFHLWSAFMFVINCASITIFPVVGTFFYFRYQALREKFHHELNNRDSRTDPDQLISFSGQGVNDQITLSLADFIYGQAQDNYVELHFILNNNPAKKLIRASLSQLAGDTAGTGIIRCHRSYLVNLYHVRAITGNSSGYKLTVNHIDVPLPVSKSYQEETMTYLRQVKNFA